jgi:large subunit ribosomal protein L24
MRVPKKKYEGKMLIRKGDEVLVLAGKDKGKKGRVLEVDPEYGRVVVEKVNIVVRHQRPRSQRAAVKEQTGRVEKAAPIPVCKVMLISPISGKPLRASKRNEKLGQV